MIERPSYARLVTEAVKIGVLQPERFLAVGVIARWVDDLGTRHASPIDEDWADIAGVPFAWLEQLRQQAAAKDPRQARRLFDGSVLRIERIGQPR